MRDLQADFLGIYGIDLRRDDIDGPSFFALANRAVAYQGVMAARAEAAREETPASSPAPAVQGDQSQQASGDRNEISLTAFRVKFPGWVSVATSDG